MLLVVDIGNTNIVFGVFEGKRLRHSWRLSTRRDQTADEYAVLMKGLFQLAGLQLQQVHQVALCSVVPPLNESFQELAQRHFSVSPLFVEPTTQDLMPIRYHFPADVGADRIVNAVAAYDLFGGANIVVDFGTATTFDAVSQQGEYLGGTIAPGLGISAEALFLRAAKLPRIDIRKPPKVIGDTTVASMQAGLFYGYVGLVEGILERMKAELGPCGVVATGGLAPLIGKEARGIDRIEEHLTLHGLRIFHERYRQSSS